MILGHIINALSMGSCYALIALGYTMVYGALGFINFAHGDLYMVGAYIGLFLITRFSAPLPILILIAMITTGIVGIIVEKFAYKPLRKSSRLVAMISSIGVSIALQVAIILIVGPQTENYRIKFPIWIIAGANINSIMLTIFIITCILMVLLTLLIKKTHLGIGIRCISENMETSSLMGISPNIIISVTFFIGTSLGCLAGILNGLAYYAITPYMGTQAGMKAFTAAILGGIGSVSGAMLGGLLLGIAEYAVTIIISSSWRDGVAFLLLIIFLLIRPTGIMGTHIKEKA